MNGKDLWNAMNYINEEYIADADAAIRRRNLSWRSAAIAAVLVCVIGAAWWMQPGKASAPEAMMAKGEALIVENEAPAIMRSMMMPEEMTVRLLSQEDGIALCTVVESTRYAPGTQLHITIPEGTGPLQDGLLRVYYRPQDEEPIRALEIVPEENVSDS